MSKKKIADDFTWAIFCHALFYVGHFVDILV